jgi:hypothetical protein
VIKISLILLVADMFPILHPFVTSRKSVEPPVDEHAKPIMDEPLPFILDIL